MKLKRITGVLLSVIMVLSGVSILYADNNESDSQLNEDNVYSDTLTETDVDTVIEADEIIPETIPDTEASNVVDPQPTDDNIYSDTSTETDVDIIDEEADEIIPETIPDTEASNVVNYPLPGGDIHFDTSTGTITGIDRTVTETNVVIPDTILGTRVKVVAHFQGVRLLKA